MDTPSWLADAQQLMQQGNLEAALSSLETGLAETPSCVDGWELKGRVLQALQRYGEAAEANQEALKWMQTGIPSSGTTSLVTAEDWLDVGNASYRTGDWETAIEAYDRVLTFNPGHYQAWNNRGSALDELGLDDEAINSYAHALMINPGYYQAWFNQGISLDNFGRYKEAIASFDRVLEINPNDDQALLNRGVVLKNLKRYEEALACFDQALTINPDSSRTLYNRGIVLGKLERYKEAITAFDETLKLAPDDYRVWYDRGVTFSQLRYYEDEIASYNQALKINPNIHRAWYNRGTALYTIGHHEDAIASFDKAISISPDSYKAWDNRGHAASQSSGSNLQSADQTLPSAMQNPALDQRGYLGQINSLREGLKYVHLDTHPEGWGFLHLSIGDVRFSYGNRQESPRPYWRDAVRSYETALSVLTAEAFPESHLKVLQGLIRAHLALGNKPVARMYQQQGIAVFEQLRAAKPDRLKPAFEKEFSSFSQLEIDLLVGENDAVAALEQAEFYKNRCLTWILDDWQEAVISPNYGSMQSLCQSDTAIVYWHLSPDSLTTFIILPSPAGRGVGGEGYPLVLDCDRRQQAQRFETWRQEWDSAYRDYASKKITDPNERLNHPWRNTLSSRLDKLHEILQIDAICDRLSDSIHTLILVPHRDLHRFPIHTRFPDRFTCTYLPSTQIGLNRRDRQQDKCHSPLLNVDDPKTEQDGMPYAQLESAIVRHLVGEATHITPDAAAIDAVLNTLQASHATFHFTGHAAYNSRKPEDSALALSDGLLTAKQISHLNLSSYDLICLASCETAITGKDGIATEYVGLGSAFLKAGAHHVLSTLWQVDEASSCWFIIRFYQALLDGNTPVVALRDTQQWLRSCDVFDLVQWIQKDLRQLPNLGERWQDALKDEVDELQNLQGKIYSHPFYWAAFTLTW